MMPSRLCNCVKGMLSTNLTASSDVAWKNSGRVSQLHGRRLKRGTFTLPPVVFFSRSVFGKPLWVLSPKLFSALMMLLFLSRHISQWHQARGSRLACHVNRPNHYGFLGQRH